MIKKFKDMNFRKFFKDRHPYKMTVLDDIKKKQENIITPYITRESQDRMVQVDVFSELMANRIMFFGDEVNSDTCNVAISQLLYMHSTSDQPIQSYWNCPGGDVYSGLALYDVMQMVSKDCELSCICLGLAASMGSILMQGGTPGKRSALEHSRIMIHSVSTGTGRITYPDLKIMTKETETLNEELMKILAEKSGKKYEEVLEDAGRDHWLKASECLPGVYGKLGLIDSIIDKLR